LSDTISKIIALIISFMLFFIFPIENMLTRQDDIAKVVVLNETCEFVDSVRNLGYITPIMYKQYCQALSMTGNVYKVSMEHKHTTIDPVYLDPVDKTSFQHDYNKNYDITYTKDILSTLLPDSLSHSGDNYYFLSKGDIFSVQVINTNKTAATKVQQMLLMSDLPVNRIVVTYGGMVRDEDY
jgi:hypothetical protein